MFNAYDKTTNNTALANTILFENLRRNVTFFDSKTNMAARALPSPSSPCVRTAMANDAILNSLSHGLSRGPTLAAPLITNAGDQGHTRLGKPVRQQFSSQ